MDMKKGYSQYWLWKKTKQKPTNQKNKPEANKNKQTNQKTTRIEINEEEFSCLSKTED